MVDTIARVHAGVAWCQVHQSTPLCAATVGLRHAPAPARREPPRRHEPRERAPRGLTVARRLPVVCSRSLPLEVHVELVGYVDDRRTPALVDLVSPTRLRLI